MKKWICGFLFVFSTAFISAQITVGAARTAQYFPLLKGKKIALVVNQTSTIGRIHLADSLQHSGFNIQKIFAPEHGFRGTADAGAHVANTIDKKTNIPVISLYGKKQKPSAEDLDGIDLVIFDIQDVGCRFYTFLSTLHYVMEACAQNQVALLLLDRPNPNGSYVDGPVLDTAFRSFVGIAPIPVVHGLTLGEYAKMAIGEKWIANGEKLNIKIVSCMGWKHQTPYKLPVAPSPNLKNAKAIEWYPSLCFFEGTNISVGRGTPFPFQVAGAPMLNLDSGFSFKPVSMPGAGDPPFKGQVCKGFDLRKKPAATGFPRTINLQLLLKCYELYPDKNTFFLSNHFIDKLAGTDQLRLMIANGKSEKEIRASWQPQLEEYRLMRKKYLLYD
ncbi:MAG: DUF1343 domain-containing protein [Chitinophagales bacterium]